MWGKQGSICAEKLAKGRQLYVEGKLNTRSYDKDGEKRYVTEIVALRVQFLGPKPNGGVAVDIVLEGAGPSAPVHMPASIACFWGMMEGR